jgi:hypothetical protein
VARNLRADLDQLRFQARQRQILDHLRRRQRARKVAEDVGGRMTLFGGTSRKTFRALSLSDFEDPPVLQTEPCPAFK